MDAKNINDADFELPRLGGRCDKILDSEVPMFEYENEGTRYKIFYNGNVEGFSGRVIIHSNMAHALVLGLRNRIAIVESKLSIHSDRHKQ